MAQSYKSAYATLLKVQNALNSQDISYLPAAKQLTLLQSQRDVYLEIQAMQVRKMSARTDQYIVLTSGFRQSKAGFLKIQKWAVEASAVGTVVSGLIKGISLALTLL